MGLRAFENRVQRRIFGPKRDEVTGEWRRLHNKEVYDIYTSTNINQVVKSRRELVRVCSTYGGEEISIQGFGGKHEGKTFERPRRRWEDNLKMDLREVGWGAWTGSIWLRTGTLVSMAMNFRVP
jgi:hypothetical protein